MFKRAIVSGTVAFVLALAGVAGAGEPGEVVVRQASAGELDLVPVGGELNLFAACFSPSSNAYTDREQFNVDIWNNMSGWQWASSYAIAYPNGVPFAIGAGHDFVTNTEIWTDSKVQTPIFFRFDESYGTNYVIVIDRAATDLGVHVPGDVDGDGVTTDDDALLVARASAGLENLTRLQKGVADVQLDNDVDIVDAMLIAQASAGVVTLCNQ